MFCPTSWFSHLYFTLVVHNSSWLRGRGVFGRVGRKTLLHLSYYATSLRSWAAQFIPPPDYGSLDYDVATVYIKDYYCYPLLLWDWHWAAFCGGLCLMGIFALYTWLWIAGVFDGG